MARMIDQIRASKLPSNMMQFAARGALSVPPDENIEILVYLAKHNKVFGDLARLTLAGWDEKASLAAAANPNTPREVLDYLIAPENLRPKLLPALLENPAVPESDLAKFAISASRESIEAMMASPRVRVSAGVLEALKSNPYLKKEEAHQIGQFLRGPLPGTSVDAGALSDVSTDAAETPMDSSGPGSPIETSNEGGDVSEETVSAYLAEHAAEIAAEADKPFQSVGGVEELVGTHGSAAADIQKPADAPQLDAAAPTLTSAGATASVAVPSPSTSSSAPAAATAKAIVQPKPGAAKKPVHHSETAARENTLQKINRLDVKGRIQLALKGNKEERSILIRDGTKVVALAVLDAPKLSDGEVEKFASQKNVLEAVLRAIPLKRRFMKDYIVVRNMVFNPRTPIDISLSLIKNLLIQDLKNLASNKEVSETIRKLGLKMFKQKIEAANKK